MHGISGQRLRCVYMAQQIEWFVNLRDEYIQITGFMFFTYVYFYLYLSLFQTITESKS